MTILTIYVPAVGREAALGIDPQSAIVGVPSAGADRVLVYFEGNRYRSSSLRRFDERLESAAGRLMQRYPTVAKAALPLSDLKLVGYLDYEARRIDVVEVPSLSAWADEEVESGLTLHAMRKSEQLALAKAWHQQRRGTSTSA